MKFGLLLPNYGSIASAETIARSAQLGEALGFDSVWTTDHVLVPSRLREPYGNLVESLIALTLAAAVTKRVELGTSIIVSPQREPVLLAKQAAAIDVISGGRLIFGIGVGWVEQEFQYMGADFARRGARLDDGLAAMRALWRGDTEYRGAFTTFEDALFAPLPLKRDGLPVWIGGNNDKALQRAATSAQGWHPVGLSPAEVADGAAKLRALAGNRQVTMTLRTNVDLLPENYSGSPRQRNAPGQILQGSPADVRASLVQYRDAGLEYVVVWLFHDTWEEYESSVTRFAEHVIPALR